MDNSVDDSFYKNEPVLVFRKEKHTMDNNFTEKWNEVMDIVKEKTRPVAFNTWIQPLKLHNVDTEKEIIELITFDAFSKSALENRYITILESAIREVFGQKLKVHFVMSEDIYYHRDGEDNLEAAEDVRISKLNPRYVFSTFVVGSNNELAHAAAINVTKNPGRNYNPLFIYGKSGLGKTHLMHAIGHEILHNDPYRKVLYISSEMFTNELVNAIQTRQMEKFRAKYRKADILMIDDIQFIEKKDRTQEELFHTFNTLYNDNKQIVLSSDRPPKEIESIDTRLQSRFEWGLPVDIQPPDFETRVAILRNKAESEDINTSEELDEIFFLIADHITTNIRELEGAFNRVIAHANLTNKPISKEVALEVLNDVFDTQRREIDPPLIKNTVCTHFNIKVADIESSRRTKNIVYPRQIAMYLCRELTDLSLPKIGTHFGKRDHTTVIHAYDKIAKDLTTNDELKKTIETLKSEILEN